MKPRQRRVGALLRSLWRTVQGLWMLWLIALGLLVVGAILSAAWVEPPWLLPDTRGLSPVDRVRAQTDFRNTLMTMLGGLAVLVGTAVGAANLLATQRVQWRAQVTDRFSKAIEQLGQRGDDKLDVRIGAVYALEQIAHDSAQLHWPIMEVLTAYLREHAAAAARTLPDALRGAPPADHQAIATVIGRRRRAQDPKGQRLDLRGTNLAGVKWLGAHLEEANLWGARLEGAILGGAHLEGAVLVAADLQSANLRKAHLKGASLLKANMQRADLGGADLGGADLDGADLQGADVHEARGLNLGAGPNGR